MKKLFLVLMCLGVSLSARAQTHTFPAEDTNNIFTGLNVFQNSTTINLISYTVSTLPSPASINPGTIATVTDASTAGSCTSGGGTNLALCRNNGASWVSLGGSGGGGSMVYPPVGIAVSTGAAWAAAATSTTVIGLWTGSCTSGTYLRADGACQTPSGAGDVNSSGTPSNGQLAQWTNSSTIQGVTTLPTAAVPAFTGDVTNSAGSLATTVGKINGTSLAGLATGILKNTTATGVPSIAASTDVIALWTGTCNSGTFLRADGSCQTVAGAGTVTSVGLSGTANQITVTGATPITGAGSWTLSIPNSPTLPGTTTGTFSGNLTGNVTGNTSGTAGSAATWTTPRNLAGNSVNGSANVAFSNKFIVQGTVDAGLSAAQFLGALGTGPVKNTTTTGVLSIAAAADIYGLWSGSCSSSTFLRGDGSCQTPSGLSGGTTDGVAFWTSSTTLGTTTPPTTNGLYGCGYNVTASAAVAPTCPQVGLAPRGVSGASDTILYSDNNITVVYEGSANVAVTLPTPSTLGNNNFYTILVNNTSKTVTVTPTTWTINGNATFAILTGQKCTLSVDPIVATNWLACAQVGLIPRDVTGTTDTILTSDANSTVVYTGSSAVATTLPTPTTLTNTNFFTVIVNNTTATLTLTPTTWTISQNGVAAGATASIKAHQKCSISVDQTNATQWDADCVDAADYLNGALLTPAAGQILAGATPAFTATPTLGTDNSVAGTLQLADGSSNAHTILGSAATTTNTVKFFATVPVTTDLVSCVVASTTCTLTDSGITGSAGVLTASSVVTSSDGVHNGILSLLCNTTNAVLTTNTVSILGCTAASNTAWGITLPTAENGSAGVLHLGAASSHISAATISVVTPSDATGNTSGSGNFCLVTNCVMVTPTLGAAVATSLATGTSPPTCTPGTAGVFCANEGTAPTAAASVDMLYADSTQHAASVNNNNTGNMPISRAGCINITPVTVAANTTSDQLLQACTLSANLLNVVNRTLKVYVAGVYSTAGASTASLTFKVKLCTVSGCGSGTVISPITTTTGATAALTASNLAFSQTSFITTQTAGASSAYEAHGALTIDISATATVSDSVYSDVNTATVGTIDSTGGLFLQVTVSASAGSTSNSFTERQLIVEVLD